jgi:hypothetical protein
MSGTTDFSTVLQRYRTALLEAKATGNAAKQVEADTLKTWLDAKLVEVQTQLSQSRTTIQSFVDEYAGTTSDIEQVRKKFKEVRDRGPVLQDIYETDKRMGQTPLATYDPTPIYVKSLLIAGLIAVSVVVARRV